MYCENDNQQGIYIQYNQIIACLFAFICAQIQLQKQLITYCTAFLSKRLLIRFPQLTQGMREFHISKQIYNRISNLTRKYKEYEICSFSFIISPFNQFSLIHHFNNFSSLLCFLRIIRLLITALINYLFQSSASMPSKSIALWTLLYTPFLYLSYCIFTAPPTWLPSSYVRAGNQNVIAVQTNENTTPTPNHRFVFSSPLSGTPHLGYGIKAYEGYDYLGEEMFEINRTYLDRFEFRVLVQIIGTTNILRLNVPYIAIDPLFPHHINSFDNVPVNYSAGPIANISVRTVGVQTYTNIINYTTQASSLPHNTFLSPYSRNKILLFMTSLFFFGDNQSNDPPPYRPITFTVKAQAISSSEYKINVNLSTQVAIRRLHFSMIIFDETDVTRSGKYMLIFQQITFPYTGGFIPIPIQFVDNFIMGLLSFSSIKTTSILDFKWVFRVINGTHGVYMPQSVGRTYKNSGNVTISEVTCTIFYMKTWICPNETFLDSVQDLCTECQIANCLNCSNFYECEICNESDGYFLNESTFTCALCNLEGCLNCTNLTVCEICDFINGYYLQNSACYLCENMSSFINIATQTCQFCQLQGCLDCLSLSICQTCDISNGYILNGTHCYSCSDFENCFNGTNVTNSNNHSNATTSNNYTNATNNSNFSSPANNLANSTNFTNLTNVTNGSFVSPFHLVGELLPTTQRNGCNSFKTVIPLELLARRQLEPQNAYIENAGVQITSTELKTRSAEITASYSRDINNQSLRLVISNGVDKYVFVFEYTPILPAIFYDESQCGGLENTESLIQAVQIISYILLIISLLSCKIVGLELFGVLQLAYFSLCQYDFFPIFLYPLRNFNTFNGLNLKFFEENEILPQQLKDMSLSASFLNNCNIMLIVLFCELIIAVGLCILSKFLQAKQMQLIGRRLLKQGFLTLVLFNVYNVGFSAGFYFKYGQFCSGKFENILYLISLSIVFLSFIFSTAAMLFVQQHEYGEFMLKFKDTFVCRCYIPLTFIYRVSISLYISLQHEFPETTLIVLAFSLFFIMYNIINLPFMSAIQNYRSNIIHITQLVILLSANYYRSMKLNTPIQVKSKLTTVSIIELIMISICVLISALVLVYEIVKNVKRWLKKKKVVQYQIRGPVDETLHNFQ